MRNLIFKQGFKRKPSLSLATILFIMIVMTWVTSNINWGKGSWKRIIQTDGKGYYAYLPAIFIYHDLNFGFFNKIEKKKYFFREVYPYKSYLNGKAFDKYYCGTAIAELPFFLIAHGLTALTHGDTDGYSALYPTFISVAALFYLWVGLMFLSSALNFYFINEKQKSLALLAAVFGTNLFYYAIGEPSMSHVYSFAFFSMFLYYSKKYFTEYQIKYVIVLASILALIILIRPVNGLIILIWPFAAGSFQNFIKGIRLAFQHYIGTAAALLCFTAIIMIQLIIYKISMGKFFVYAYGGESFHFLKPHMIDILFSYKKGLFLYTPMFFIALAGFYFLYKSNKFEFYSLAGFLILVTYILSSWWMWYYGGSFSSRVYVEYIPLFMVLLVFTLKGIRIKSLKVTYVSVVIALIVICQIQTIQYRYTQIHWEEMTKEKYWDVFLRIDRFLK